MASAGAGSGAGFDDGHHCRRRYPYVLYFVNRTVLLVVAEAIFVRGIHFQELALIRVVRRK